MYLTFWLGLWFLIGLALVSIGLLTAIALALYFLMPQGTGGEKDPGHKPGPGVDGDEFSPDFGTDNGVLLKNFRDASSTQDRQTEMTYIRLLSNYTAAVGRAHSAERDWRIALVVVLLLTGIGFYADDKALVAFLSFVSAMTVATRPLWGKLLTGVIKVIREGP